MKCLATPNNIALGNYSIVYNFKSDLKLVITQIEEEN